MATFGLLGFELDSDQVVNLYILCISAWRVFITEIEAKFFCCLNKAANSAGLPCQCRGRALGLAALRSGMVFVGLTQPVHTSGEMALYNVRLRLCSPAPSLGRCPIIRADVVLLGWFLRWQLVELQLRPLSRTMCPAAPESDVGNGILYSTCTLQGILLSDGSTAKRFL